jgi:hypothetical protein
MAEKKKGGVLQTIAVVSLGAVAVVADKIENGGKKRGTKS